LRLSFGVLFGLGSAVLVFSIALAQVPGGPSAYDESVITIAGLLLTASLLVGRIRREAGAWSAGPIATVIVSFELAVCLFVLASELMYRR